MSSHDPPTLFERIRQVVDAHQAGDDVRTQARTLLEEAHTTPPGEDPEGLAALCDTLQALAEPAPDADYVASVVQWVATPRGDAALPPRVSPIAQRRRYRLGAVLGRGGMGEVRAAQDERLRREVAIKVLREVAPGTDSVARFLQEAQITGQLEHPNIVPVHDVEVGEDGRPFFTMKRVRGRSLHAQVKQGEAGTLVERLDVFRKICDAVAFAHSRGVIHRDLKPANVMVGEFGEVLVLDWGLAKVLGSADSGSDRAITSDRAERSGSGSQDTQIAGTLGFMAPEQARGEPLSERTDVYSLGAMLYVLLTDTPPWPRGQRQDLAARVRGGELPESPADRAPGQVPAELSAVVMRAMAPRPEDRHRSAAAVRADVQAWLEQRPLDTLAYTRLERVAKWVARNRAAFRATAGTAAVALVVLLAGLAWHVSGMGQARDRALAEAEHARQAERQARIRLADSEVARAAADARADRVSQAVERLHQARGLYVQQGAETLRADLVLAMLGHQHLAPSFTWRHTEPVVETALSDDGLRALVRGESGSVTLLEVPAGLVLGQVDQDTALAGAGLGFSDGRAYAAFVTADELQVWDVAARTRALTVARRHASPTLDFVADRPIVIRWAPGDPLEAWRLDTGAEVPVRVPVIRRLAGLSRDGARVLGAFGSPSVARDLPDLHVWDLTTGRVLGRLPGTNLVSLFPDGRSVIVDAETTGVALWDVASGRKQWSTPSPHLAGLNVSGDGRRLWAWTFEGPVWTLALASKRGSPPVAEAMLAPLFPIQRPAPSADGLTLLTTADDHLRLWDLDQLPRSRPRAVGPDAGLALDLSPDGQLVLTADLEGRLRLYDLASGALLRTVDTGAPGTREVVISPEGLRALSADRDGFARLWDLRTGELLRTLEVGDPIASSVVFLPDGTRALVAGNQGSLALWDLASGDVLRRFESVAGTYWNLEAFADGRQVLATGRDETIPEVMVWDVETGRRTFTSPGLGMAFRGAVSPDGTRVAAGLGSDSLRVWTLSGDVTARHLAALGGPVMSVDWSPDGRLLATGSYDGTLRFWDGQTLEELHAVQPHVRAILDLQFSPDGRHVVSLGSDGWLVVHDLGLYQDLGQAVTSEDGADVGQRLLAASRAASARHDWALAVDYAGRARDAGQVVPALDMARPLWASGRYAEAREELQAGAVGDPSATVQVWLGASGT